jgi:DNA-binding MarR family transcriptional regulator
MTAERRIGTAESVGSKARLRLWLKLLTVSRLIEAELRERLRAGFDTTLPRFDVMAALGRSREGLKMSELSAALRVSNGNVTGIVGRLVADGLVVRVPVKSDRRAMTVRLTRRGEAEFARLAAAHEGWIDGLLDGVTLAEADRMIGQLKAMCDGVEERRRTDARASGGDTWRARMGTGTGHGTATRVEEGRG